MQNNNAITYLQEKISSCRGLKKKISNSYGLREAIKYYRSIRPKDSKYAVRTTMFYAIIREMNDLLGDAITKGNRVILPCRMGILEIRKRNVNPRIVDGKVVCNRPIMWGETLKLWKEDEEAFKKRTLVKTEQSEIYSIFYNRQKALFKNKVYYKFRTAQPLRDKLRYNIENGIIKDAFNIY